MKKEELVELTIDQLLEAFKSAPECFEYHDKDHRPHGITSMPTIIWQPKFELKDGIIPDPNNNPKTVIVALELEVWKCYILPYAVTTISDINENRAEATVACQQTWLTWRKNYKKFMKLKNLIITFEKNKQSDKYMRKLCKVFPTSMDDRILG